MLVLLLSLAALARGQHLPVPQLRPLETGGAEFSIQDVPGVESIFFNYRPGGEELVRGQAWLGLDGVWRHQNVDLDLSRTKALHYKVTALFENGAERKSFHNYEQAPAAVLPPGGRVTRGAVVFRDDFNSLDKSHWHHEVSMYGGYNGEFQVYTPDPLTSFTRNGHLYLKPIFTVDHPKFTEHDLKHGVMDMNQMYGVCTIHDLNGCHREGQYGILPPVMSAKIMSNAVLKFGTVEVRAKIPRGDWIWPAIWMMPKSSHYGNWPASGEIDIMESRGNTKAISGNVNHGVSEVSSTLHWGPSPQQHQFMPTTGAKRLSSGDWAQNFHTYKLDWTPDHLITYVDNQEIMHVNKPAGGFWQFGHFTGHNVWAGASQIAPFDQEFYLILNVAVGGTGGFFYDMQYDNPKPWSDSSPHAAEDFWNHRNQWQQTWHGDDVAMQIDYVEFRHL